MSVAIATWGDPERDIAQSRRRVRFTMVVSVLLHAILLAMVVFQPMIAESKAPVLTQIVLIDPSELEPPAAAAAAPAARGAMSVEGLARSGDEDVAFRRSRNQGNVAPESQSDMAFADQVSARLSALRSSKPTPVAGTAITPVPSAILAAPSAVSTSGAGRGTSPISLKREGPDGPALGLAQGSSLAQASASSMAPARVGRERAAEAAPTPPSESVTQRSLAGASIAGPIADRVVISHATPVYPEWAKRDAVEGSVTLYFVVRPDGAVKENVLVQKTAGFEDFDESARSALRTWRFEPLRGGRLGEQWGTITFRFRLSDTL
jgi:TonB family protein